MWTNPDQWTPEQTQMVEQLARQNQPDWLIAERVGRSERAVRSRRVELGIRRVGGSPKWPDEMVQKAESMLRDGASDAEIAAAVGKTRNAVIGWRLRRGHVVTRPGTDTRTNAAHCAEWRERVGYREPSKPKLPAPLDIEAVDLTAPHHIPTPCRNRPLRRFQRDAREFFAKTGWRNIGGGRYRRAEPTPAFARSEWLS